MRRWQPGAAIVALTLTAIACSDERITDPGEQPGSTWDLMFYATSGNLSETMVLPPSAGGFPERIFPVGRFAMQAAGSPDGTRIAYVVRGPNDARRIYVADRDGRNPRPIGTEDGLDGWPAWSPDGNRIAFQSGSPADIFVVNVDGTGLTRLTQDPLPAVTSEVNPAWSPDGTRIAFAGNVNGHFDIFTMRPDGSDLLRLTDTPDSEVEPSWSPAGDRLVVRRVSLASEWDIVVLAANGATLLPIALPGWQSAPAWKPDGESIAFTSRLTLDDPWQVWSVAPDGSGAVQQTPANFTGGQRPGWLRRP